MDLRSVFLSTKQQTSVSRVSGRGLSARSELDKSRSHLGMGSWASMSDYLDYIYQPFPGKRILSGEVSRVSTCRCSWLSVPYWGRTLQKQLPTAPASVATQDGWMVGNLNYKPEENLSPSSCPGQRILSQQQAEKRRQDQRERFSSREEAPDTSQLQNMLPNVFNNVHNNYNNQLIEKIFF